MKMVLGAKKVGDRCSRELLGDEGGGSGGLVSFLYTRRQAGEAVGGVLCAWSERHPGCCLFSYPPHLTNPSQILLLPDFCVS